MTWLSANLEVLRQRWPRWNLPQAAPGAPLLFEERRSSSGHPSGIYRGAALHSLYDPLKEAQRIGAGLKDPQALILGGFALGYQAQALRSQFPQVPLLVVEPDPLLFSQALTLRDLRSFLGDPLVNLMVGSPPSSVAAFLEALEGRIPSYVPYRPQQTVQGDYFHALTSEIEAWMQMKEVNRNTRKKFMGRWSSNFLQNWENFPQLRPLGDLRNGLTGYPGVIAAAGPSLEGCLSQLRQHRNSFVLVAVDTAYSRLREEGIAPDFLVSTDAQYWNSRHLDHLKPPYPFLIGEMTSPPRFWRGRADMGFLADSAIPLFRDLGGLWNRDLGVLPSGGSVATTAWSAALLLGLYPLVFAGLDLAFPREENHIRGSTFEELHHCRSTRIFPAQTSLGRQGDPARQLIRTSWKGSPVTTDVRMDLYRRWFESQFAANPERAPHILRPQGQRIQGCLPLEDLGSVFPSWPEGAPDTAALVNSRAAAVSPLGPSDRGRQYKSALESPEGIKTLFRRSWESCIGQFGPQAAEEWDRETAVLRSRWKP